SPYLLPMVVVWSLVMVAALRALFAGSALQLEGRREFASFYGLPRRDSQPWRSLVIALCAQGMVACAVADRRFWAAVLIGCGVFLFAWRWTEVESALQRRIVSAVK